MRTSGSRYHRDFDDCLVPEDAFERLPGIGSPSITVETRRLHNPWDLYQPDREIPLPIEVVTPAFWRS